MPSIISLFWTAVVLLVAPIAGFVARPKLLMQNKPRVLIYAGSAVNLILIGAITAIIDIYSGGKTIRALSWSISLARFGAWSLGLSLVCILITLSIFGLRRRMKRPPSAIVMSLLPATGAERALFLLLCLLIGLVEEFLFRGFAFSAITGLTASWFVAAAIVTISFALQHGIQDSIGIARAFVLGIVLIVPVAITGSLLPSIIAHAVVDAFSGLFGRRAMQQI